MDFCPDFWFSPLLRQHPFSVPNFLAACLSRCDSSHPLLVVPHLFLFQISDPWIAWASIISIESTVTSEHREIPSGYLLREFMSEWMITSQDYVPAPLGLLLLGTLSRHILLKGAAGRKTQEVKGASSESSVGFSISPSQLQGSTPDI